MADSSYGLGAVPEWRIEDFKAICHLVLPGGDHRPTSPPGLTPDLIGVGPHAAATLGPPKVQGLPPWVRWAPRSTPCLRGDPGAL